jgi:hypothetical protein
MTAALISSHDAEEQLRPALGALFEATDARLAKPGGEGEEYALLLAQLRATNAVLDRALELLGVQR